MKKIYGLLIIILFLIFPSFIKAEECDIDKITITKVQQIEIEGKTEEKSRPTFEDGSIKLDLKMYDVNDSITYNIVIKNDNKDDYMIDKDMFKTNSLYIEYTLTTEDNNNVVKGKNSKNLSLKVTYKKEVEKELFSNNKYDASNKLEISMNTEEKEKELDIITTDNIKKSVDPVKISNNTKVENPLTSSTGIKLITIILLTVLAIILLTIINKKKYNKYNKYLILTLSITLLPVVYAVCKCDIEVKSNIVIERIPKMFDTIVDLSKENNSCITKYEGQVTDEVGKTVNASNVYFDICDNKRNIIFGGYCWQIIRTTETGGIKVLYYGKADAVDRCDNDRDNEENINSVDDISKTVNSEYLYADEFSYDKNNWSFTLINPTTTTWSDDTYKSLIGKFTCMNATGTCSTIYGVSGYVSNSKARLTSYVIGDSAVYYIGKSPFNGRDNTLSSVGYMYNYDYIFSRKSIISTENKFGNSFIYDSNSNTYTLSGMTQNISTWRTGYNQINNTHYTCWNTTGICDEISYVYNSTDTSANYIILKDGKNINDALIDMLSGENTNKNNSSVKGIIDSWYRQNLVNYSNKIEDTVYCNSRNIINYAGWNPDGGSTTDYLEFKNHILGGDLSCSNITDQFSLTNSKAKLTYPVALLQNEESYIIAKNNRSLLNTGTYWLLISPDMVENGAIIMRNIFRDGRDSYGDASLSFYIRPVITLSSNVIISSGTGTETDPWIIE